MAFFSTFFLSNIGQENVFYDILDQNNAFVGYKKQKFKKSKNWHFSKWFNPWFWFKKGNFCNFFFLGDIGQENVFYHILGPENDFLGSKKRSSKCRKSEIFPKGLTYGFGPKMAFFQTFFF